MSHLDTLNVRKLYVGLHLLLLACERILATKRSKTYENEKNITLLIPSVSLMWCISIAVVFIPNTSAKRTVIVASSFLVFYAVSITVRENVETAFSLFRCFVFIALQSIFGWSAVVVYNVFRLLRPIPFLEGVTGFIFDVDTALSSTTIPIFLYLCSDKVRSAFKKQYSRVFQRKLKNSSSRNLVGLEGNQLRVDAKEEANVYFQQLQHAWN
ncbi:hypothetical protein ANCCEY_02590 [Ancylostoma ceylanicum]|uniref:Uncharacterized protein n=1 Tax=Ancylostoma ceylanicum TaxID=53326 RepID=A0A0D6M491_9BILA|nr:hypothetical protein ANCCEY_02590 [Ancylostoma ceylanicum]